jgi:hypothetical protein
MNETADLIMRPDDPYQLPESYRLVRNIPLETLNFGRPRPFAPLYDAEEIDDQRVPLRVIAFGDAESCRRAIAKATET